jgi:transcriptional regulator with XRE-family HTH domain
MSDYERQGTGYDPGAAGHELQGRASKPVTGIDKVVAQAGTHQHLADFCTVSRQAVAQWVKQGYPPPDRVAELANYFNVPAAELIHPKLRAALEK